MAPLGGRSTQPARTGLRGWEWLLVALAVPLAGSTSALADGVTIRSEPVGCIVAQAYPKVIACFEPAEALARARLYFRLGGAVDWYYVEMAPDAPCHAGILPKPRKSLVGQQIEYYIQATDRSFNTGETEPRQATVAADAAGCAAQNAAAAVKAASVAVFPAMPAGFSGGGGASALTVVGIAAGGTAVAGTTIAVAGNGDDPPTTSPAQPQAGNPGPQAATTTTTSTTTTLRPNTQPQADFTVNPNPPRGASPLEVTFNMCRSGDPDGDELQFSVVFGDGSSGSGACRLDHTYRADRTTTFQARACVSDGTPGHEVCHGYNVEVQVEPAPTATTYYTSRAAWHALSTRLLVDGAHGQVVLNREHSIFPEGGSRLDHRFAARETNVIEAQLVKAGGTPGLWHFEIHGGAVEPGSLRAVAGEIESLTQNAITFRLKGHPGERVVFIWRRGFQCRVSEVP